MKKVVEESSKRSVEILTAERRKRVQMREAEIVRECMKSMILEVVGCTEEEEEEEDRKEGEGLGSGGAAGTLGFAAHPNAAN